jgi:hypothetical protein
MAETSRNDVPPAGATYGSGSQTRLPGQEGALPELPETSAVSAPGRSSNAQLNRSAKAVGHRVGTAVAGVRNIPQHFDRLRSRIHLVNRSMPSDEAEPSFSEVAGDWRDAVEGSVSEMTHAVERYRMAFMDRANIRLRDIRLHGERSYYTLRRNVHYRTDKIRRLSAEQPLQFLAVTAATAFVLGVGLRLWRSNHD